MPLKIICSLITGNRLLHVLHTLSNSLQPHGPLRPWNSPGQNTEVSSRSFLQGIFPTHLHEVKLIETESGMRAAGIGARGTGNET